jgi:hypothetical protein
MHRIEYILIFWTDERIFFIYCDEEFRTMLMENVRYRHPPSFPAGEKVLDKGKSLGYGKVPREES